jgi:hypothetical protein
MASIPVPEASRKIVILGNATSLASRPLAAFRPRPRSRAPSGPNILSENGVTVRPKR